jgi:hypothetical protein
MTDERLARGNAVAGARERTQGRWWLVAGLLIIAFLARAPLYLSVFPPFEGWDEYQHLAYIVHLDRTGSIPVLGDAPVSLALRPLVVSLPHSPWGSDQVKEWGAASYADYWKGPPPNAADRVVTSSFRLYQAQHPPLAYTLALPVWRALTTQPLEAIYAIRAMNLLLVAAALALFAAALTRLVPAFAPRVAVLALVCLHPLFFQNVARVANDALALAAGVAGISLLLLADGRTLLTRGVLAAVCIAASIWSKQTGLTLVPALVVGLPLIGRSYGVPARRLWRVTGVVLMVLVLLVAPWWYWSYQHYGAIVTTQESLELVARGDSVVRALVGTLPDVAWAPLVHTLFVPGRVWVGGWSFLPVHDTLARLHDWLWIILLGTAALGAVVAVLRRTRPAPSGDAGRLAVCAAVVVFTALGMIHHAIISHAVFGRSMTNPWYFMTALPFLFVLVVRGLGAIGPRLASVAAAALAALFVVIDLHGTWVQMPAAYTGTTEAALQWSRLSSIHPAILSGDHRWWFLAIQLAALCIAVSALLHRSRRRA